MIASRVYLASHTHSEFVCFHVFVGTCDCDMGSRMEGHMFVSMLLVQADADNMDPPKNHLLGMILDCRGQLSSKARLSGSMLTCRVQPDWQLERSLSCGMRCPSCMSVRCSHIAPPFRARGPKHGRPAQPSGCGGHPPLVFGDPGWRIQSVVARGS